MKKMFLVLALVGMTSIFAGCLPKQEPVTTETPAATEENAVVAPVTEEAAPAATETAPAPAATETPAAE